jgi:hypothetical protein
MAILHIIHDNRRPEKLPLLEAEMLRQGISYTLWSAEVLPDVVESINASHKKIVRYALEHSMPEIAIAEDDVWFPAVDGWKYFLANKPQIFDVYSAGTYGPYVNDPTFGGKRAPYITGFHCYIIDETFYKKFLSLPATLHIDAALETITGIYKVCYPFAAIQRPGWSANNRENVDYNKLLKNADVYGGIPKF